jgi:hypothetical protein
MAHLVATWRILSILTNMSEKCQSTSPSEIQVKNWWKKIVTDKKLDVISRLGKHEQMLAYIIILHMFITAKVLFVVMLI